MSNLLIKFLIILVLVSFMKKLLIDWTWVSPIPSRSTRLDNIFSLSFVLNNFAKFFIDPKKFKLSRNDIIQTICNNNIPSFVGSCGEVYLEESMIDYKPNERLSNCIKLFETSIMLLCDPTISLDEATNNIFTIIGILSENLIN